MRTMPQGAKAALKRARAGLTSARLHDIARPMPGWRSSMAPLQTAVDAVPARQPWQGDTLVSILNRAGDINVKVVVCRDSVQEAIIKQQLDPPASIALAELMACTLLMSNGMKDQEKLQINVVGNAGFKNFIAISNGEGEVRGMVGNPSYQNQGILAATSEILVPDLVGQGQVQVVKSHPSWLVPYNGVTQIYDFSIATNLALYLTNSEQRGSAIIADANIHGALVRHIVGVYLEKLPGASPESVMEAEKNMRELQKVGLRSFVEGRKGRAIEYTQDIINALLGPMEIGQMSYTYPCHKCGCGTDRVKLTIKLLPREEVEDILNNVGYFEARCEFCGSVYRLSTEDTLSVLAEKNA